MKKIFFIILIAVSFSGLFAQNFGAGIMLGEPTGLSAKYYFNKNTAIDFGLGYSFGNNSKLNFHTDFIYMGPYLKDELAGLRTYYGFGARIKLMENRDDKLGVRGVAGLSWHSKNHPIELFIEVAPVFNLIPETDLDFDGALGFRYYFETR